MSKASKQIEVINALGLHARPAMQFVDVANQFSSDVAVHREGDKPVTANGKSVMEMVTLEAVMGTKLRIEAEGDDAEEAVRQLADLFAQKFDEDE